MTQKILGPEGSKRRKRFWLVPMLAALFAVVFYVAGAQAVHDTGKFELDGNAPAGSGLDADGAGGLAERLSDALAAIASGVRDAALSG